MRTRALSYILSIGGLAAAVLLRWLLDPVLGDGFPLVTLFGAVAAAAWLGGWRPAVVVILVGFVTCSYLFITPRGTLGLGDPVTLIGLAAYLFTCSLIVAFAEARRRAQMRAAGQRELLLVTLRSIGDAVITTDNDGRITDLNVVAEAQTGWTRADALARPLDAVFRIVNQETRVPVENAAVRAARRCCGRPGQSHGAHSTGRQRVPDRRQRGTHTRR